MFKKFYPYEYVDSVFSIDYQKLVQQGYRGIIFDIDNTLVHHGEDTNQKVDGLFYTLQALGLKTFVLSNNSEERIVSFLRNIETLYLSDARKPESKNYLKALEQLELKNEEVLMVGDQLFTDIYGANKVGIPSILVKYMRYPDETKIGIRRTIEKVLLKMYQVSPTYQYRLGDVQRKEQG